MSINIPRFLGRGGAFWVWGGEECRFDFYGREDFCEILWGWLIVRRRRGYTVACRSYNRPHREGGMIILWCGNHPHPHKMRKLRPKLRPRRVSTARIQKYCKSVEKGNSDNMVRVSSPAKLRPWPELTAKMVMGVVPGLVIGRCHSTAVSRVHCRMSRYKRHTQRGRHDMLFSDYHDLLLRSSSRPLAVPPLPPCPGSSSRAPSSWGGSKACVSARPKQTTNVCQH